MRSLAWRSLWTRRGRTVFASLAVVCGVAFVSATLVVTDTMERDLTRGMTRAAAHVDAAVTVETGPVPRAVVTEARSVPEVRAAAGERAGPVTVLDGEGRPLAGPSLAYAAVPGGTPRAVARGRLPRAAGEAVLDRTTLDSRGATLGDEVAVVGEDGRARSYTVVGAVDPALLPYAPGTAAVGVTGRQAGALLGATGWQRVVVQAAPGVPEATVAAAVAEALGPGYEVRTGSQVRADTLAQLGSGLTVLRLGLLAFAGVALLVAGVVVLNTFAVLAVQRTRESALLRCVGATRGQTSRVLLTEAAVLGLTASAVGVAAGVGAASGLVRLLGVFGPSDGSGGVALTPQAVVAGLATGVGLTVLAAAVPAVRAGRVPPVTALGESSAGDSAPVRRWRTLPGVLAVLGGAGLVAAAARTGTPEALALGGVLAFGGVVLLGPVLVPAVARLLAPAVTRAAGVPGRLATRNAVRHPRRAATTALALVVGVSLVSLFGTAASSLAASVSGTLDARVGADVVVADSGRALPGDVVPALREVAAAASVATDATGAGTGPVTEAYVDLRDGMPATEAREAVETALADFPTVRVLDRAAYKEMLTEQVDQLLLLVTGLVALAVVIALLGIGNTVALGVAERTRESAVLRALGLTGRQLSRAVVLEAAVVALVGGLLGVALGTATGAAVPHALAAEGIVPTVDVPVGRLALALGLACGAAVLAAWLPARRAGRVPVVAGLADA